jgi:hypothetical protein
MPFDGGILKLEIYLRFFRSRMYLFASGEGQSDQKNRLTPTWSILPKKGDHRFF